MMRRPRNLGRRIAKHPPRYLEYTAAALLVCFISYVFFGPLPLAFNPRLQIQSLDRLYVFAMFGVSLLILGHRRASAWWIIRSSFLIWAFLALCLLSVVWALDPMTSLRRVIILIMLATTALAIVVGIDSLRMLGNVLMFAFGYTLAIEYASMVVIPESAFAYDGFRGVHSSKNVAGFTAFIIVVFSFFWTVNQRRFTQMIVPGLVFLLASLFLVLSESKTCIGLAAIGIGVVAPLIWLWRLNSKVGLFATLSVALFAAMGVLAIGMMGWTRADVFEAAFGDPTFSARTDIWAIVSLDIAAKPWLGFGYGSYWSVEHVFDPLERATGASWLNFIGDAVINQAHNGYMDLQVQLGILGPVLASLVFLRACYLAFVGLVSAPPRSEQLAFFSCSVCLISMFFIHNLMEASMFSRMIPSGHIVLLFAILVERMTVKFPFELLNAGQHTRRVGPARELAQKRRV